MPVANAFLDLYPQKLNWALRLPWQSDRSLPDLLQKFNNSSMAPLDPMNLVKRALPETMPIKVTEILPRLKDGGAFVKFEHDAAVSAKEVEATITAYLTEHPVKPWFNPFGRIRTSLVEGRPWVEDLYRPASNRVKVEFVPTAPGGEAAELSQESLFEFFRKFGRIAEITSQPSDSKVLPKYAYMDFAKLRNAIMAKNCIHGMKITEAEGGGKAGTLLRLSFERRNKEHWIWNWLANHPRIVIPAVAALVTTVTLAIFDPIRTFFIRTHIDHSFHLRDYKIVGWFIAQANDFYSQFKRKEQVSLEAIWDDRKQVIDQMQTWLMETADTFIVVQGPRGSGKKELIIDQALKNRKNVLYIDCKPIQDARGDSATISAAAKAVGYRPVFSWMNSISSLVDLAAQGTIGVKSGFSQTLDAQLQKIWQNTATALQQIALQNRNKNDKDAALSDDDWLEAHAEYRPVVVLDNFLHKNDESSAVYDKLAEWAASLTTANVAHVIFLTNDIAYSKSLGKALPDRVFRQIALGDISPEVARRFVKSHLEQDQKDITGTEVALSKAQTLADEDQLDGVINILGGRLTDLEFLARRLKTGQTPEQAITEITEQSASELIKMFILTVDKADRKWSPEQAWYIIKKLATHDDLRYNEVVLSNTFSSSLTSSASNAEAAIEALSAAELITIQSYMGRPRVIKAGKPVYQAAFRLILQDRVLRSRLDLAVLAELTKIETKSIDKIEQELSLLGSLPKQPREVGPRIEYLLRKLEASQTKVEGWEQEMGKLKHIMSVDY